MPGLGDDPRLWGLTQLFITGVACQYNPNYVTAAQEMVYDAVGNKSHKYAAVYWLDYYQHKTGIPLKITDYDYENGTARAVQANYAPEVEELVAQESKIWLSQKENPVSFVTGCPFDLRDLKQYRDNYAVQVQAICQETPNHPAQDLLNYVNSQSDRPAALQIQKTQEAAQQYALENYDKRKAARVEKTLAYIDQYPCPRYVPTERGCRVFARGQNLNGVPREIRKILLAGCVEIDLQAAQLAIASTLWGLPELGEFLRSGRSIWKDLHTYSSNAMDIEEIKPAIKEFVYSACYGMCRQNLLSGAEAKHPGLTREHREKLLIHPLIEELLEGRDKRMAEIRQTGGAHDAFGIWRPVLKDALGGDNTRSPLCIEVQSHEMAIMIRALPVIKADPHTYLMSWLHDGMSVKMPPSRRDGAVRRLVAAIDQYCQQHDYPTRAVADVL